MKRGILFLLLLLFTMSVANAQAMKRAVFEKFTSVACGSCANGTLVLADVLAAHPDAIAVAHHVSVFDSMTTDDALEIFQYYAGGTPMGVVNRYGQATTLNNWETRTAQQEATPASATVSIDSLSFDPSTRLLTVGVTALFTEALTGEFRFNVILTENEVTKNDVGYHQRNYNNVTPGHPLEGLGHPIVGFVHQHVQRVMLGGAWGLAGSLPATSVQAGETFSHLFTVTLDEDWNEYNMHAVGILQEYGATQLMDREILNAEEVPLTLVLDREETTPLASQFKAYPNPVQDLTTLNYTLEKNAEVHLLVTDLMGRTVSDLYRGFQAAGSHSVIWDARAVPHGTYLIHLNADAQRMTARVVK